MKRRIVSLLVVLVMAIAMGASVAAVPETANIPEISSMSAMQTMSAETLMAFKGKFTDFFPDENFAQAVATQLQRNANDEVTLYELQSINKLLLGLTNWEPIEQREPISYNTEGIGDLMQLESLAIYGQNYFCFEETLIEGVVEFTDDIQNCGRLKKLELTNVN